MQIVNIKIYLLIFDIRLYLFILYIILLFVEVILFLIAYMFRIDSENFRQRSFRALHYAKYEKLPFRSKYIL